MARATGRYVLDLEVTPTDVAQVTQADLDEVLMALQIRGAEGAMAEQVFGAIVVALVKHLKRNGKYIAVALDPDPVLDDAEVLPPPER